MHFYSIFYIFYIFIHKKHQQILKTIINSSLFINFLRGDIECIIYFF